jgi:hypothetical protein
VGVGDAVVRGEEAGLVPALGEGLSEGEGEADGLGDGDGVEEGEADAVGDAVGEGVAVALGGTVGGAVVGTTPEIRLPSGPFAPADRCGTVNGFSARAAPECVPP